ncbi:MAG: pyridoxal phosphate-dependent aminotransferase [Labilithrix sp.]|nr:pyridoxal phosphate-dependent aminotransferase [Labilithrix sp.]MCW5809576.1 pyridoxal phosphate-dependent aminotransferase [Labilithrix sp.]
MTFSRRSQVGSTETNALTLALASARAEARFLDLTASNPTTAGLPYDQAAILSALDQRAALVYEPQPLGLASAREVVAKRLGIDPARVAITASTSEAYAVLFKAFCDPGDEVLVPSPSYPLLDWLASFEGITLRRYPLVYAGSWHVDVEALARAVGPKTRAIVAVAPNNPTGQYLSAHELDAMLAHELPVISDEVFASYPLATRRSDRLATVVHAKEGLVFALSGLSKLAALPQMKLGWIAAGGDPARVNEALARLELVLDAYLSVGAPVQHALPELLHAGELTADAIRRRTKDNLAVARAAAAKHDLVTQLDVEAGWYVTWRVPATMSDEEWALTLLREDGVYVHPGYFFDMSGAHLVLSLLTPEPDFRDGIERIVRRIR